MRRHLWRFVLTGLLVGAGLPMMTTAPAAATPAAPAYNVPTPDGVCLSITTCADEAAWVLWNAKDPVFWQFAYMGVRELLVQGMPMTDGEFGCSYPTEFGSEAGEQWSQYRTCVSRVQTEATFQYYAQLTADEKEGFCAIVPWYVNCQTGPGEGEAFVDVVTDLFGPPTVGDQYFAGGALATAPNIQGVSSWGMPVIVGSLIPTAALTSTYEEVFGWDAHNDFNTTSRLRVAIRRNGTGSIDVEVRFWNHNGTQFARQATVLYGEGDYGSEPIVFAYQRTSASLFYLTMVGPYDWQQVYITTGGFAGDQNVFDSSCVWSGANCDFEAGDFARVGGPVTFGEIAVWSNYVYPGTTTEFKDDLLVVHGTRPSPVGFQPLPAQPGTEEVPVPTTAPLPTTTTIPPPPTELEPAANPTGTHEERQTGLLENLVSGVADGFNWLGNKVGGLLSWIGELIKWLGDIFGYWIQWLWANLYEWLKSIRDAINSGLGLIGGLLGQLLNLVGALLGQTVGLLSNMLGALATMTTWIAGLPELIWQKFLLGLQTLFVPTTATLEFPVCATTFPCNFVQEAVDTVGGLASGVGAAAGGACTVPSLGFAEFTASLPPPSGCAVDPAAVTMGSEASNAGDLFGWRVPVRLALLLLFSLLFLEHVISLSPWATTQHYRYHPEQQTMFG